MGERGRVGMRRSGQDLTSCFLILVSPKKLLPNFDAQQPISMTPEGYGNIERDGDIILKRTAKSMAKNRT